MGSIIHVLETNALVIKVGDFTIASPCSNPFVVYQLGSEFADCVLSTSKLSAEEPLHHPTCSKHVYQVSEPASEKKRWARLQVRDFLFHERCVSMYLEEKLYSLKLPKRHAWLKLIHFFRPKDVKKRRLLPQPCGFFQQTLCSKVPRKPRVLQSLLERSDLLL